MTKKINIYAAFCGTGKSYMCCNSQLNCKEFECWKYVNDDFPNNYIEDIIKNVGEYDFLFISTNPIVLKKLHDKGFSINLIYPDESLKQEYFERFMNRNSSIDFLTTLDNFWHEWISELKRQGYCKHYVLSKGEYITDILN